MFPIITLFFLVSIANSHISLDVADKVYDNSPDHIKALAWLFVIFGVLVIIAIGLKFWTKKIRREERLESRTNRRSFR